MKKTILSQAFTYLLWMTALTGVIYPGLITLIAQIAFPYQANGSLLIQDGKIRGSILLGQDFDRPGWFHARPSASNWGTLPGGASNLAATNPARGGEEARAEAAWLAAAPGRPVPPDMASSSGSGLDPDISLQSALSQLDRVARERHLDAVAKTALERRIRIMAISSEGLLGPPRVNVVELNASLTTADPAAGADPAAAR